MTTPAHVDATDTSKRSEVSAYGRFPSIGAIRRTGVPGGTPGRLVAMSAAIFISLVIVAVLAALVVGQRWDAIQTVRGQTALLAENAREIHAHLADADAVVATSFLSNVETREQRNRFDRDIRLSQEAIIEAIRVNGSESEKPDCATTRDSRPGDAAAALVTLSCEVPFYTGLVSQARANNREGYPVGAAYIREATELMQNTVLPAADVLARTAADRHHAAYHRATGRALVTALVGVALLALLIIIAAQLMMARWTNRLLSIPLVVCTLLLVGGGGWQLGELHREEQRLVAARDNGYVPWSHLTYLRVLALRAQGDAMHWRIAQGGTSAFDVDFGRVRDQIEKLVDGHDLGRAVESKVTIALSEYDRSTLAPDTDTVIIRQAGERFRELDDEIDTSAGRHKEIFDREVRNAEGHLLEVVAVPAVLVLAAFLAAWGVNRRTKDYHG